MKKPAKVNEPHKPAEHIEEVARLHEYNLDLPVKQSNGDTAWRRPSYSAEAYQGSDRNGGSGRH
jgi:hypothetical protein